MRLFGQMDQMGENAHLRSVRLHLAEDNVRGMERSRNFLQVALVTGKAQNSGVPDHVVSSLARRGKLLYDAVAQSITDMIHAGVAGLVVKPRYRDDGSVGPSLSRPVGRNHNKTSHQGHCGGERDSP